MSKIKSLPAIKRRFSRGDAISHSIYGDGHVSETPYPLLAEPGATPPHFSCRLKLLVPFQGKDYVMVPESELTSRPGHGLEKYGQGRRREPMRVGGGRYGERPSERSSVSNGRMIIRRLVAHHNGPNAR